MSRLSNKEKLELTIKLKGIEQRLKRTTNYKLWDAQVKLAFSTVGAFSFEELICRDVYILNDLIESFSK
jgi:hypothetical protein